ncbi:MAG: GMC family oxidoreductase [Acidobacteria bacterium]|nr:GMC family oxidoreductase [Acidobacteriota bacterium]
MEKIIVIGSGASGVHFALSLLEKGYEVVMLDVGHAKPPETNPKDRFNELKSNLSDPVEYFLGSNFEAVVHPGSEGEYYGFPPHKSYVFSQPESYKWEANGFSPLLSFARGGLAEAWSGGSYPLNDVELRDFPFDLAELAPYYGEVARRIGISGVDDDLARFQPTHDYLMEPLRLDSHSRLLLDAYKKHKQSLNQKLGCYIGRARVATLSRDLDGRKGCDYSGRCHWGCPSGSFYTPSLTLKQCQGYPNFTYMPGMLASHFKIGANGRVTAIVAESLADSVEREIVADRFALAAGTLSSSKIFLDSIWKATGEVVKLTGLMDNRQILIPFINLNMIGEKYESESYQYQQIVMGFEGRQPDEYFHGIVTTLKTALIHPIVQNIPLDLRMALSVFRNVRAGLGVVNLNFPDHRRESNFVTLQTDGATGRTKLLINYAPPDSEPEVLKRVVKTVKKALWKLGCIVPPGMMHTRPMGASVHYAGTIPMSTIRAPLTSSPDCRSHDFDNLYFADGTTFPALSAKNLTFSLMANAVRMADRAF